jgi:hypothetical protein
MIHETADYGQQDPPGLAMKRPRYIQFTPCGRRTHGKRTLRWKSTRTWWPYPGGFVAAAVRQLTPARFRETTGIDYFHLACLECWSPKSSNPIDRVADKVNRLRRQHRGKPRPDSNVSGGRVQTSVPATYQRYSYEFGINIF